MWIFNGKGRLLVSEGRRCGFVEKAGGFPCCAFAVLILTFWYSSGRGGVSLIQHLELADLANRARSRMRLTVRCRLDRTILVR